MKDSSVLKLCEALKFNNTLQNIDLSLNRVSNTGASAILELLKKKQTSSLLMINIVSNNPKNEALRGFQIEKEMLNEIEKQISCIQENRKTTSRIVIRNYIKQSSNRCKLRFDKNIIKFIIIPLLTHQDHVKINKRQSLISRLWSALSRKFS